MFTLLPIKMKLWKAVPICLQQSSLCVKVRDVVSHGMKLGIRSKSTSVLSQVQSIQCYDTVNQFVDRYDTFLLDCDGVLWENDHKTPLTGISQTIGKLHSLGKKVLYVTNNSIISRKDLRSRFHEHGFSADMDTIFSNAYTAAVYTKDILKVTGKVYLVGGEGMKWELDQMELDNFGVGPDPDMPSANVDNLLNMEFKDNVECVVVGFDYLVGYNKIYKAATYLMDKNCHFVATNDNERGVYIGKEVKRRMPMTGMIVNSIAEVSKREATVVGKPHKMMFKCLQEKHPDTDKSRSVMIGDSLKVDIGFAKTIGLDSVLVLTGNSTLQDLTDNPDIKPTYVMESFGDISR